MNITEVNYYITPTSFVGAKLLNYTMSKINIIISSTVALTFITQCQKPVETEDLIKDAKENTLNSSSIGSGLDGVVTEYFYNFEDQVEAKFFRYRPSILQYDYGSYFSFLRKDPPSMS